MAGWWLTYAWRGKVRFDRVLLLAVCLVAAMVVQGESVARQASSAADAESTQGSVVGASIAHPANWTVERERYTFHGTYGFTLWRPEQAGSRDHGGVPAVRVALAEGLRPGRVRDEVGQ